MHKKESHMTGNPLADLPGMIRRDQEMGGQSGTQSSHQMGPFGENLSGYDIRHQMGQQSGQHTGMGGGFQYGMPNETTGQTSVSLQAGTPQGMHSGYGTKSGVNQFGMTSHHGNQLETQTAQMGQIGHIGNTQMGNMSQTGNMTQLGGFGQSVNTNQMAQQAGSQTGQQAGQWNTQKFGAHEMMMVNEVLTDHIDGINQFELYRSHVKDQNLMQILDNQVKHIYNGYQNMINYLQNQGMGSAVPYRVPKTGSVQYGLRQPAPVEPNSDINAMDDRDVASGMLGCNKASAVLCTTAALECADQNLRSMITNCAVSSINQAYEVFQYMNQKGMYQVPTLTEQTTQTLKNTYQPGSRPIFQ